MIGQHIYSRCLEGYFSKSLTADSTTVTISADMFAREEQAKIVARECEKISVLEDIREVPSEVQGAYRGALKIRRLNRQLTVVCRSYRLHSEQSGSGETRDFTYGSSYILTGEDRERFLEKPEYFLNIRNFEPYPSVMKRIRESREMGKNGKIEASTEFSLFEGECPEASPEVFRQAGFTRELFIDYISGIIQRVSYSHYEGHERDKVLLVLPQRFNVPWVKSGGNRYAEEVLAATMRILPSGVREQLSAMVGGMDDADAAVLDGYQLVFMEAGNSQNWRKSEYTVIDLDRQESFVPEMTDNRYGEFLWDYLMEEETRRNFERQYVALFGKEKNADGDNSPEKYAFVMEMLQEAAADFADDRKRTGLLLGLMGYCSDDWSENARNLFCRVLEKENSEPQYDKEIERTLLNLLQEGMCPQEAQEQAVNCILNSIYRGDAEEASIQWVCEGVREGETVIVKQVKRMNALVDSDSETQWYKRKSLLDFYYNVCGDSDILAGKEVKKEILSILSEWYISFLEKEDWENCAMITRILSEQLEDPLLEKDGRKAIYQDLLYILFFGEGTGRDHIMEILKKEERKFQSEPEHAELFWESFRKYAESDDISINDDLIWQMTYLAVFKDETFLREEWEPVYQLWIAEFGTKYRAEIFEHTTEYLMNWVQNVNSSQKRELALAALIMAEKNHMEYGSPECLQDMKKLRMLLQVLKENGKNRACGELLYGRYLTEAELEKKKKFFVHELNEQERWQILLSWALGNSPDSILKTALTALWSENEQLLQVISQFEWREEKEEKTAAEMYFYLLECRIKEEKKNENSVETWNGLYRTEYLKAKSQCSRNFTESLQQLFRDKMVNLNPKTISELERQDVLFLRSTGMLPLGEGWESLDIVSEIYAAEPTVGSREFWQIRRQIVNENSIFLKQVYRSALESAGEVLLEKASGGELLCNIALLEEQMDMDLQGGGKFNIKNAVSRITRSAGSEEILETMFRLLLVVEAYGGAKEPGSYDCNSLRTELIKMISANAEKKTEQFCNKKTAKAYQQLSRETKQLLEKAGFNRGLKQLPKEWLNEYGLHSESSLGEWLIPGIVGLVCLLFGIGMELLFMFPFRDLEITLSVIVGTVFVGIGVIGNLAVVIWRCVSEK